MSIEERDIARDQYLHEYSSELEEYSREDVGHEKLIIPPGSDLKKTCSYHGCLYDVYGDYEYVAAHGTRVDLGDVIKPQEMSNILMAPAVQVYKTDHTEFRFHGVTLIAEYNRRKWDVKIIAIKVVGSDQDIMDSITPSAIDRAYTYAIIEEGL